MNNKGQSVMSEYVMIFFVVIAAVVAMTTFVQRGLEARVHDTRDFMITQIVNSGACDANCLAATGAVNNQIPFEYEPYYSVSLTDVGNISNDNSMTTTGNPQALGAIYARSVNEATTAISTSSQLPPCASANPVPAWCGQ